MANILIVTDNEVINSIYSINLKIYTDSTVTTVSTLEEFLEVFADECQKFDFVIASSFLDGEDVGIIICNEVALCDYNSGLLMVGEKGELPDDQENIKHLFDLKSIIGKVAKSFGITAKQMAALDHPDFYPMPIRMFFPLKTCPCDTFFKEPDADEQSYHKIFAQDKEVWPKIKKYLDHGVSVLYISQKDRFTFTQDVTTQLIDDFQGVDEKTEQGKKLEIVEEGIETVAEQIFDSEMTEEVVELSNKCIDVLAETIEEAPDLKSMLRDLTANKSGFLYSHSIIAGVVASHIIDQVDWGSDAHKERLKFVLFFHDMYLTSVYKEHPEFMYEDKLIFDERLTEAEKEVIVSHALEAADVVSRFPRAPMGVDAIIRQHHGTASGLGFADVYKDDVSPLAKVIIVSEGFTEELLKTIHAGQKVDVPVILERVYERFSKHTYIKIAKEIENIKL
jgi:hypothetical protein